MSFASPFTRANKNRSSRRTSQRVACAIEALDARRMLCFDHSMPAVEPIELRPDLVGVAEARRGAEPAVIDWTNRATTTAGGAADTDGFGATFGTSAPLARAVVDAVIVAYERMIGSFNYAASGATYALEVNMQNTFNFNAGASISTSLGGKPSGGGIFLSAGMDDGNPNSDNGWFLDPTPFESSEFQGDIVNAFAGEAQAGSPAFDKRDFYTVVALEMTHAMGLFGNLNFNITSWHALTTDTGIPDLAEAGSSNTSGAVGTYWVFRGPSIKHLMTSNNGGSSGNNLNSAIHSAGPDAANQPLVFEGDTYIGAEDQGNAVYERGRRYLVNQTTALMFKDAYGYSTNNPARFDTGSMYVTRNEFTGVVLVRGSSTVNVDRITITRSGSTISFSVDPAFDVPGTGALPGIGDLPAWETNLDISQVTSIRIEAGEGNDAITIGQNIGRSVSISGGNGNDAVSFVGTAFSNEDVTYNGNTAVSTFGATTINSLGGIESLLIDGGMGINDQLTVNTSSVNDTITVNNGTITGFGAIALSYVNLERVNVNTGAGNDTINLNAPDAAVFVDAGADNDIINVNETLAGLDARIQPNTGGTGLSVNVNSDDTGSARAQFAAAGTQRAAFVQIGIGGHAILPPSSAGDRVLRVTAGLFIDPGASLDLSNNAMIFDYIGASPLNTFRSRLSQGYNGGAWNGPGINSSTAAATPNRALGFADANTIFSSFPATFAGESVDNTTLLVRFTRPGDTNLDRTVNLDDFTALAAGFGQPAGVWRRGDFNYDQAVNLDDFTQLAANFGLTAPADVARPSSGRGVWEPVAGGDWTANSLLDDLSWQEWLPR